jgi:SAM-dependent methyltransferase
MRRQIDWLKRACKSAIRQAGILLARILPLSARQSLVAMLKSLRLPGDFEFSMGLFEDLRRRDPVSLHRFLWSNHLAYAQTYEIEERFGPANINPTRHILFRELADRLRARGMNPMQDIGSVFEVGCSMGYLLRHLEEEVFPSAGILHGIDIDAYAVETGAAHLARLQSKVKLFTADMEAAGRIMGERIYDLAICCGVLMYVNEAAAADVVRTILSHARCLVGLICLAHPGRGGSASERSEMRATDGAFIHNVDRMIRSAGGKIVSSKWIGTDISGSSPSHVIVAEPPV